MGGIIAAALSGIASAIGGFFNFKGRQADALSEGIGVLRDIASTEGQREMAIAMIIAAENNRGGLAGVWRPLTMLIFVGLVVGFWFGYVPPHLNEPMGPMVAEIFLLIKIGLGGYIPARSLEKIVSSINVGKVLDKYISKRLG